MARGPTTFTTVLTGETAISAGAMLRPCIIAQLVRIYNTLLRCVALRASQTMCSATSCCEKESAVTDHRQILWKSLCAPVQPPLCRMGQ